jgi:hypothetical protein
MVACTEREVLADVEAQIADPVPKRPATSGAEVPAPRLAGHRSRVLPQAIGGLTRGITLRAIRNTGCSGSRRRREFIPGGVAALLDPQHCAQFATVRFRRLGPSDPNGGW